MALGARGSKRFAGFRRVGGAGFAAQPTIEHGESPNTVLIDIG